jgi:hypothetical protein
VTLYAPGEQPVEVYSWVAHATFTFGRCPDGSGPIAQTEGATRGAANDCPPEPGPIVINEVESNPTDWVEFKNRGSEAVDISSWYFTDSDPTHVFTFPNGTVLRRAPTSPSAAVAHLRPGRGRRDPALLAARPGRRVQLERARRGHLRPLSGRHRNIHGRGYADRGQFQRPGLFLASR